MSHKRAAVNDANGLRLIDRFRWLRPAELGIFLWPHHKLPRKSGEDLVSKWERDKWIIRRKLPGLAGSAVVLSERGAAEIAARSGKDWGGHVKDERTGEMVWQPPGTWKHELLQSSLLAWLFCRGYSFISERQLRMLGARDPDHIPDGLVIDSRLKPLQVWWLEVESARKSGAHMDRMAENLIEVATTGTLTVVPGFVATAAMLAFIHEARDERNYNLHHLSRVVSAICRKARRDIKIMIAIMETDSVGAVVDVTRAWYTIPSNEATRVLASIDWVRDVGVQRGVWRNGIEFAYWRSDEMHGDKWCWETTLRRIDGHHRGEAHEVGAGTAKTADKAKRAAYEAAVNSRDLSLRDLAPE